jgi:hypothetical protein
MLTAQTEPSTETNTSEYVPIELDIPENIFALSEDTGVPIEDLVGQMIQRILG